MLISRTLLLKSHSEQSYSAIILKTLFFFIFTCSVEEVTRLLEKAGLKAQVPEQLGLDLLSYARDELCPKFIKFHRSLRSDIAQSTLVRGHHVVLQVNDEESEQLWHCCAPVTLNVCCNVFSFTLLIMSLFLWVVFIEVVNIYVNTN
jgi:hypothetical protein